MGLIGYIGVCSITKHLAGNIYLLQISAAKGCLSVIIETPMGLNGLQKVEGGASPQKLPACPASARTLLS